MIEIATKHVSLHEKLLQEFSNRDLNAKLLAS